MSTPENLYEDPPSLISQRVSAGLQSTYSASNKRLHAALCFRDDISGCLLCRNEDSLQACHVAAAAAAKLFARTKNRRLVAFSDHRHLDNRILLCSSCHSTWDSNNQPPRWVMLPSNLDYFLSYETAHAPDGTGQVPSTFEYRRDCDSQYTIYCFDDPCTNPTLATAFAMGNTRRCGASPTAILCKAQPSVLALSDQGYGLPPEVIDKFLAVWRLYMARPDTWEHEQVVVTGEDDEDGQRAGEDDSGGAGSSGQGGGSSSGSRPGRPSGNRGGPNQSNRGRKRPAAGDHQSSGGALRKKAGTWQHRPPHVDEGYGGSSEAGRSPTQPLLVQEEDPRRELTGEMRECAGRTHEVRYSDGDGGGDGEKEDDVLFGHDWTTDEMVKTILASRVQ